MFCWQIWEWLCWYYICKKRIKISEFNKRYFRFYPFCRKLRHCINQFLQRRVINIFQYLPYCKYLKIKPFQHGNHSNSGKDIVEINFKKNVFEIPQYILSFEIRKTRLLRDSSILYLHNDLFVQFSFGK